MLGWSIISLASFLLLASLDETICGTMPRSGVHLKPPSVPEAPAAGINKTIINSHVGHQGHNSPAEQTIPAKDQSSVHRREKPLTDTVGSNDTHSQRGYRQPQNVQPRESSFVAFTAHNDGKDQGPYEADKAMTFNKVVTNVGGGFDPMFSFFICPVSGYYLFSVSIIGTSQDRSGWIDLVHDGRRVVDAYGMHPFGTASLTANLHVVAGGRVWVSVRKGYAVRGITNSFSGSLVKPDAAT